MHRPRWTLAVEASCWRVLMQVGMSFHHLAPPRPMSPSFAITIPATVASRAGVIGLSFYTPEDYVPQRRAGWKYPVVVNFHGGGFTLGKATDDARWATHLVVELDAVVVSVDYRLAPEQPFPIAVEDGVDAIDLRRFAMSGFSAGGNLAFTVPLMLHEQLHRLDSTGTGAGDHRPQSSAEIVTNYSHRLMDLKIVALIAWYPPTDYTMSTAMRRATCTRPQQAMRNFFVISSTPHTYIHEAATSRTLVFPPISLQKNP